MRKSALIRILKPLLKWDPTLLDSVLQADWHDSCSLIYAK